MTTAPAISHTPLLAVRQKILDWVWGGVEIRADNAGKFYFSRFDSGNWDVAQERAWKDDELHRREIHGVLASWDDERCMRDLEWLRWMIESGRLREDT